MRWRGVEREVRLMKPSLRAVLAAVIVAAGIAPGTGVALAQDGPSPSTAEGVPDPAGRIAFGRIVRMDDMYGQVVALYAIDPDGSDLVQLTDGESAFPAWSPDGTRLAFTMGQPDGSWQIATMTGDGSDVRVLTTGAGISEVPTWSPDGASIVYDTSPTMPTGGSFHTVLYRMDADGSHPELLGDPDTFDVEPRFSPDGRELLFERVTFEGDRQLGTLMVRDLASGQERTIDAAGTAVEHGNWSPDGQWIIYDVASWMTDTVADDQLERIAADGSGKPVVLVEGTTSQAGFKPWYSPDGTRILFGCHGPAGDDAACIMHADGSDLEILVDEPGVHENHFSWGVTAP
jgi:Tol biopolymer transport system component